MRQLEFQLTEFYVPNVRCHHHLLLCIRSSQSFTIIQFTRKHTAQLHTDSHTHKPPNPLCDAAYNVPYYAKKKSNDAVKMYTKPKSAV